MAGQVALWGTPHLPFCKKTPCNLSFCTHFTKSPSYLFISFCKSPFSLPLQQERNSLPKSLFFLHQTLTQRTPLNSSTSISRLQGFIKGFIKELHLQPQHQDQPPPLQASTTLGGLKPSSSPFDQASNWTHPSEYLTHQDLDNFLFTCNGNSYTLVS